jgi:hypothetical protein
MLFSLIVRAALAAVRVKKLALKRMHPGKGNGLNNQVGISENRHQGFHVIIGFT